MPRVLAAVDGTEAADCVADYILNAARDTVVMEVVVINAQPKPQPWRTRGIARQAISDRLHELGRKATAQLTERLEQAQIATRLRLELGDPADTIVRCAKEEGCDMIVMGARRPGRVGSALLKGTGMTFRSVAAQVVKLADIPVVVVK
jgi:nucleotide-binding universal stress UspA family protein